ncbi:MAG: hypothetical protein PUB99_10745 [Oscillospiraceae bacterium]|nr:hypothetical protein [Oscillospiraceae bacterium]
MLGKLIKNEFKSTAHSMFGVFLAAGITFVIMLVVFLFKVKSLMTLSSVVLGAIAVAVLVITLFSIITMFNKSLYGAQGYLSFTLPVTGKQLLASKTIVSLIWVSISFLFAIAVTVFLVVYWVAQTSDSIKQVVHSIYEMLQNMEGMPDPQTAIKVLTAVVVALFVKALFLIFKVAFSLAIANTKPFQKYNPIFIAILVYIAIYLVLTVGNVCAAYIPVYLAIGSSGVGLTINEAVIGLPDSANIFMQMPILGYVFEIIVCSLLYVATGNIMTNHVNIK